MQRNKQTGKYYVNYNETISINLHIGSTLLNGLAYFIVVVEKRLRWYGHVLRRPKDHMVG